MQPPERRLKFHSASRSIGGTVAKEAQKKAADKHPYFQKFASMDWNIQEFLKPVNMVSVVLGLAGLITAFIFFLLSQHEPKISYHVAAIPIVDQKETVPFSVIGNDGQPVTENVYATSVTVWNSGDLPADVQNIRRPLTVALTGSVHLLIRNWNISPIKIFLSSA